jgi:radical SAM protein with 4Fe4S-binding SPASM domain
MINMTHYQILLTPRCNLKCAYCYHREKPDCGAVELDISPALIAEYAEAVFKYEAKSGRILKKEPILFYLWGGEATLRPDLIDVACAEFINAGERHGSKRSPRIGIITNGLLTNTPAVRKTLERWKKYLKIQISIDGDRETHDTFRASGTYDRALNNAKTLQDNGFTVCIKGTYFHNTFHMMERGIKNLIDEGFSRLFFNVSNEERWGVEESYALCSQMKSVVDYVFTKKLETSFSYHGIITRKIGRAADISTAVGTPGERGQMFCGAGRGVICLGTNGALYGCHRMAVDSYPAIGRLENGEIRIDPDNFIEKMIRGWESKGQCKNCLIQARCQACVANMRDAPNSGAARNYCGCAFAMTAARLYYVMRMEEKYGTGVMEKLSGGGD